MTIVMGVFLFLSILLIGIPFLIVLVILHIVYSVLATLAASRGEYYTYPLLDGIYIDVAFVYDADIIKA